METLEEDYSLAADLKKRRRKRQWNCTKCCESFDTSRKLRTHRKVHRKKADDVQYNYRHDNAKNIFICYTCDFECVLKEDMEKHVLEHEDKFSCKVCDETFVKPYEYSCHLYNHDQAKGFSCPFCKYTTHRRTAIMIHINTYHLRKFIYTCHICGKGFNDCVLFKEHNNVHEGKRPFRCIVCDKDFVFSSYLTSHQIRYHRVTIDGVLGSNQCCVCFKSFIRKTTLEKHMKTHNGDQKKVHEKRHLCDICGKGFAQTEKLRIHYRVHTGIKPYTCSYCAKGFIKRDYLIMHERVHSGEKPSPGLQTDLLTKYGLKSCVVFLDKAQTLPEEKGYFADRNHISIHSDVGKINCRYCHRAFQRHNSLFKHEGLCSKNPLKLVSFKCCRRTFTDVTFLCIHVYDKFEASKIATCQPLYSCRRCSIAFNNCVELRDHSIKKHHIIVADDVSLKCPSCPRTFDFLQLLQHKLVDCVSESLEDFLKVCGDFDVVFKQSSRAILNNQELLNFEDSDSIEECDRDINENSKDEVFDSVVTKTSIQNEVEELLPFVESGTEDFDSKNPMFFGNARTQTFCPNEECMQDMQVQDVVPLIVYDSGISTHAPIKEIYKCDICSKEFHKKRLLRVHRKTHSEERLFKCDICLKYFKTKATLSYHTKIHTNVCLYQCAICPKVFRMKSSLEKHKCQHSSKYNVFCSMCKNGFYSRQELTEHVFKVHNSKLHKCKICGKPYVQKYYLNKHMLSHTVDYQLVKDYKCTTCGKAYFSKASLNKHIQLHNSEKWMCDICGKAVTSKCSLQEHLSLHQGLKPFKCTMCDKGFVKNSNLKVHFRSHTGIKPYRCETCGKCFTQRSSLVIHIRHHTGEKPYKCSLCNNCFVSRSILNIHKKSKHRVT
ncbi:hypothetical protein FQA39_LY17964 [Lamprigera yunnana]|nr:hypothetical protein FQA39_LY17964 [Lamprigera yunnana]